MRGVLCGLAFAGVVLAQGFGAFEKAPPQIDDALRTRIAQFYQAHVDGKFRVADQVVAEDSKDEFFGREKTQYRDYRISSITYSDNYTKAKVVVAVGDYFVFPQGRKELQRPDASNWKYENGQWWWYIARCDPKVGVATPFGTMSCSEITKKTLDELKKEYESRKGLLQDSVKVSRTALLLPIVAPSSEEVTLTNTFEGPVTLDLQPIDMPGLSVKLDKTEFKSGEVGKLLVSYKPDVAAWKPEVNARISVVPTAQVILVRIEFAKPTDPSKPPK